jgi:thioredoxin reductase (NADPH)
MKPIILAVDDDPGVLRAVARDLRTRYGKDFRVLRAGSGADAMAALEEVQERGDPVALLLSDQRMPQMDGVQFLTDAAKLFPKAKRALLTAYADTEAAIAAINKSGVDYYLLKPWDPPEQKLYPVLDDLLADWKAGYRPGYGGVRVIGDRWGRPSHAVRDFLARNQVPYQFLDVEADEDAQQIARRASGDGSPAALPVVVLADGTRLDGPTPGDLAERLGMQRQAEAAFYDLAIVGAGPAGLAAAVYGASEGLKTVLVERDAPGGQAGTSSRIENYLGFPSGLSGADLARRGAAQAKKFGVELLAPQEVTGLRVEGPYKILELADDSELSCHALMLANGVDWRTLEVPGAEALTGRGVYYGAAMSEAMNCTDEHVYVVGGGNSAGQAALYFADYAARVTVMIRGDDLGAKMSRYLVDRIYEHETIDVQTGTEVNACHGDDRLERLTLSTPAGLEEVDAHLLFIFIGAAPRTDWLGDHVARDTRGFIRTGPDLDPKADLVDWPLEREPFLLEASVPGVFCAGDVRHQSVKRVASAVGEGSVAVQFIHRHLATL